MDILNAPRASHSETAEDRRLLEQWTAYSIIGLFVFAILAALQAAADIVVPIFSALFVGSLLAQIIDRLVRLGLTPAIAGSCVVVAAISLGVLLVNALIDPFSAFVDRAPKMTEAIVQTAARILAPLSNLKDSILHSTGAQGAAPAIGNETAWITTLLGRLTPAIGELLVFFASLAFFVAGRAALRKKIILSLPAHESRLKAIRAFGAVENALVLYFGATALVYAGVALALGVVAFVFGLGNPLLWSAMTFVAAYVPYLGVTLITVALAATGVLTYPHAIAYALAPAMIYLAIHGGTELAIIPTMLGRRHEINPFLVFLSIVFWSWMWGPVGAILAVPLLVTMQSLVGVIIADETRLP